MVLGNTARRAGSVLLAAVLSFASGISTVEAAAFARPRFVKQISASPFADIVTTETDEVDTESEPHIAVDPADPSIVVAVMHQSGTPYRAIGYATSHDGGRVWASGSLPGLTHVTGGPFEKASDPVVTVGPDGTVHALTIGFDGSVASHTYSSVVIQRSDDGGLTFAAPVSVEHDDDPAVFNDKPWIAIDGVPTSAHYGRVYVVWTRFAILAPDFTPGQLVLRYSDDRGATWSDRIPISGYGDPIGAQPLVHPSGALSILYSETFPCSMRSQTSLDGGEHFDAPVFVATCTSRMAIPDMRTGLTKFFAIPSAAVDPAGGRLYVVWEDSELGPDGFHAVALSTSSDGGASWTPPRMLGGPYAVHRFTPAVAALDGAVIVSFRSRVPDANRVYMRYVASSDAGATFGRERKLGRAGDLRYAVTTYDNLGGVDLFFLGDYMALAMAADGAHAVWCRPSRPRAGSGHHQTTWSATIPRGML